MTARQVYEGVLIELHKENAPNLLLEDFNYFINKAINQYINKRYNIYDINQQTTDDLRVLKATALLDVTKVDSYADLSLAKGATYEVNMPMDYLHLLNCICIYKVHKTYKCYNAGDTWRAAATRLTADAYSQVLDNFWLRPTYKRPYYYIHNINQNQTVPTNPYNRTVQGRTTNIDKNNGTRTVTTVYSDGTRNDSTFNTKTNKLTSSKTQYGSDNSSNIKGTDSQNFVDKDYGSDGNNNIIVQGTKGPTSVVVNGQSVSNVERGQNIRYGNRSRVRLEIRYGTDDSVFELIKVYVDYIKAPQYIRLTQEELDYTEDKSQLLEFPDYVCQEIINELVNIIMENISDQRLQTHPVVSQSIANPAQQQAEPAAQAAQ